MYELQPTPAKIKQSLSTLSLCAVLDFLNSQAPMLPLSLKQAMKGSNQQIDTMIDGDDVQAEGGRVSNREGESAPQRSSYPVGSVPSWSSDTVTPPLG
ncbi:uncharacterized protein RAG0_15200 [Rhynchosporium agropyri]|uniref:Uncharacterized protein n=1 Tax=Rhynchosporium agropyri TaxID=914238 RepID=A0A1E1LK45_9HELO|nr:uncharacterized protein RAG0_15200 [Rhynchosporium agropyri]